ncbi:MAG TPA: DUF3662 and FHA domain-containing protein [Dermatophilaceae bacterium]|nr:DUF3662 and FHA domain-containing protein [Dermatophilaceae bacterium]
MGLFDRLERGLERAVNGAFARAFKAEVQPVEIAAAMRRAMDDRAAVLGRDRTIVPNLFTIELARSDYDRLTAYSDVLTDELVAAAQEHAETQRYSPGGRIQVSFASHDELETGVFRVRPSTAKVEDPVTPEPRAPARTPPAKPKAAPGPTPAPAPAKPPAPVPAPPPAAIPSPISEEPKATRQERHERAERAERPERPVVNAAERPWLDIDGEHYPLLRALTVLGRDESADIVLDDPGISRRHTELRVTTDGPHFAISIRDLGSTNGTYVNGERVTSQRVQEGDRITVGRTSVTLRLGRR